MARLPVPGVDQNWGSILNEYLTQVHANDGSLKADVVGSSQLAEGAVGLSKLSTAGATDNQVLTYDGDEVVWADAGDGPQYPNNSGTATVVPRPYTYDIRDYGGVGDGVTDNTAAFLAVLTAAKNARCTLPFSLSSDFVGTVTILIPAGDYVITGAGGLLGQEASSTKIKGLVFQGVGAGISNIIFNPSTAGSLVQNDYWLNLQFRDLGFYTAVAGCTFFDSNTTHNAQRFQFISCNFNKWKYVVNLRGNNNNSEMFFLNCHAEGIEGPGAFFYVGPTSTSDQFLNYWFIGCTHWVTDAPFIDSAMGGHYHIYGLDASAWGSTLTSTKYLFNLRGATHALGVCSFTADGVRVEAKNAQAGLLYSQWPHGNVTMQVDWSSQANNYTYGNVIDISYSSVGGAIYRFHDSHLAGGVRVGFAVGDWAHLHKIIFENCFWRHKNTPSDVVTYDTSAAAGNSYNLPPVEFKNCRSNLLNSVINAAGAATWDVTIGYRGDLLQTLTPRVLSLRGVWGVPNTSVLTAILPQGALITDFEVLSPAGAVSEVDGGTWTLATTEATPATVATATVPGAMSAGYHVKVPISIPFHCNSAGKAKLTITPSGVGQNNSQALLLIKGYC